MNRSQIEQICKDLKKKMVLLTGPRQVGKTTIAQIIQEQFSNSVYLNFDNIQDRQIIENQSWLESNELIILDELHKMPNWKNYLKGIYDTKPKHQSILVTGSARLEVFNKIGDSLAGRYFLHRLLPLSAAELHQLNIQYDFDHLLQRGGFPEPFLVESDVEVQRWRTQYINSMLSTDVFNFEQINNINALQTIFELLRTKVGSPISYQSLARDVSISPSTAKRYVEILEALYLIFRVTPFSKNIARSLLKEPKIYFFDNGLVKGDNGAKLENMVAVSLLKHCYGKIDLFGENYILHYLRTKDGLEVDFALVCENEIETIIEVKNSGTEFSKTLHNFSDKYSLPGVQIVKSIRQERKKDQLSMRKASRFLEELCL